MQSLTEATCPACGFHVAVPFYDGGKQPLATLAWPATSSEARELPRYPIPFIRCVDCGHVYNPAFEYCHVPYSRKPNLMFNRGVIWSSFIRERQEAIASLLPDQPTVVEIGHGDGSFLQTLSTMKPGHLHGFDPHGAVGAYGGVTYRAELFDPMRHLQELNPAMVISRHVLEHLTNPLGFLQQIAVAATLLGRQVLTYFEVPCIDNALKTGRTVDFYYEHSSQFTTESFTRMLTRCAAGVEEIGHGYDGEVIYGIARLGQNGREHQVDLAAASASFHHKSSAALASIGEQLEQLLTGNSRVAIWGGTGKSAAFICRYGLDSDRFPVVVDSDPDKVGTYVPGTGQEIRFRDYLKEHPVDTLIIPPQWRAKDILLEMSREGISVSTVLIEEDGRLVPLPVLD
jgi:hypothetical protein